MTSIAQLTDDSIDLLKQMITIASFSREEEGTASLIGQHLMKFGVDAHLVGNNVIAYNQHFDEDKPTVLLNSHHDTVKPNPGYTRNPFAASIEAGKLYGLGSNDAGGCLVSLIAAFLYYYSQKDLRYNICLIASAEEEVSGKNGIEEAYRHVPSCEFAIVGEPTLLDLAVAEKGLMVLDCVAHGESGHAAREEGVNAIYNALEDIYWFKNYQFEKISSYLGPVKMSVTMINAGSQHNVVPASCSFVVDVRTTDMYSNEEVLNIIQSQVQSEVIARSTRLNSSTIDLQHPIVLSGIKLGKKTYGSPTMSDQALLPIPSLKIGPGDSARSHTADEFIYLHEIEDGVKLYIDLLRDIL
ncbi:M20/M25/M40 family metallo-hydrolase [Sphingobacterium alkalisoli]|uniref:M20/M25/M40 family metallo-hydrolase n=1 Tax=Sphingobacterium alkalisoli TaxID=1874115 RepID=A0A4U0H8X0_9SPHI|nr:M20 family metallo-hydrolase [Sphingobacterium alkalisoli]TJY68325.1 M20/M25/M40 family metallo-hydrolase [Sphingobacterium alkalisoli]GGH07291.1 acetylornithine deacetylase [Sphingobacterium alkalisoli]